MAKWQSNVESSWLPRPENNEPQRDGNGRFVAKSEDTLMEEYRQWKRPAGEKIPRIQTPQIDESGGENLLETHLSGRRKVLEKYMKTPRTSEKFFYLNDAPGGWSHK